MCDQLGESPECPERLGERYMALAPLPRDEVYGRSMRTSLIIAAGALLAVGCTKKSDAPK